MEQLIGILMDLGLGAVAVKLTLSLERTQKLQTELLSALTERVEALENLVRPDSRGK